MRDAGRTREEFVNCEPQIYEFFELSTNIPSGLSCLQTIETCGLLLLYNTSEDD